MSLHPRSLGALAHLATAPCVCTLWRVGAPQSGIATTCCARRVISMVSSSGSRMQAPTPARASNSGARRAPRPAMAQLWWALHPLKQLTVATAASKRAPVEPHGPRRVPKAPRAGSAGSTGIGGHGKSKMLAVGGSQGGRVGGGDRYYPEPKKKEINGFSLWSKVFLDKGNAYRTIGRAYALIFRNQTQPIQSKRKRGNSGILAAVCGINWIRRG